MPAPQTLWEPLFYILGWGRGPGCSPWWGDLEEPSHTQDKGVCSLIGFLFCLLLSFAIMLLS